jgi:glycosyltransferase involved in cell wall biosynthesis
MPLISVVIPIYNGEETIQETLKSVFDQTFQDFEVIVINDGSRDNSLKVLQEVSESRLTVYSYPNSGQAASRNRGISHSNGKYIAFLDADDLWTPDKLDAQLKALQNHPKAALAYSWTDYIDEVGNFLQHGRHITANGNIYEDILVNNFIENGSNPLVDCKVFSEVGNFDEKLPPAEDWEMWIRIASCYEFVAVPKAQVLYRVTINSSSANIPKQEKQCLKAIDKAFSQVPDSLKPLKHKSLTNIYKYLFWKAIEGYPSQKNGRAAARCFWNYMSLNPKSVLNLKFTASVILKIIIMSTFPPKYAKKIFNFWAARKINKQIIF